MIEFIAICAVDKLYGIGKDGDLPWKDDPDTKWDMQHFKETTTGYPVIMGYNTYKSLGKPLPNRINFVVNTHTLTEEDLEVGVTGKDRADFDDKKFIFVNGFNAACKEAKDYAQYCGKDKVFIIGGKSIYDRAFKDKIISRALITHLDKSYNADTFFNQSWLTAWSLKVVLDAENLGRVVEYSRFQY